MATTAHAIPTLQKPVPEDMDLHSDSGLDFGDGDIELDLDPAPANVPHGDNDGDVSINDATSVAGLDGQTVPTDQDDFMADHEDLIGVEHDYAHDNNAVTTGRPSTAFTATASALPQTLAPPDEDLLDYSDDEAEPAVADQPNEASSVPHHSLESANQTAATNADDEFNQEDSHNLDRDEADESSHAVEGDDEEAAGSDEDHLSAAHSDTNNQTEGEDDRVSLQEHESFADNDENEQEQEHSDHSVAHEDDDLSDTVPDNEHQDQHSIDLQPVTVNYAGNELWFFKQHDLEESGDWLLEDISLAASSMSDLFQACRISLGDDVSNEHEIGLRFDNLHNLELYEDNTACVAVSLQRLVDLYHTLHAQDGNKEPESFYCSLLFRPRFVTLLSDIAKYADQESGYSGLDAAISAGETHFSNALSSASTEHEQTDWDDEDQEETGLDTTGSANYDAPLTGGQAEYDDEEGQDEYADDQEDEEEDAGHAYAAESHINEPYQDYDVGETSGQQQGVAVASHSYEQNSIDAGAGQKQEDDLLDYDDEGEEEAGEAKQTGASAPSASSSTVQGDDTATGVDGDNAQATNFDLDNQDNGANHAATFQAEDGHNNQFNDHLLEGIDDTTESYQNFEQGFDQGNSFQDFGADGNTDQNYDGFEYQGIDQQLQIDFMSGPEFNGAVSAGTNMNEFAGADDFLDLNNTNTSEWVADQDTAEDGAFGLDDHANQDKEDDAAKHPAVAASSTADPETASSPQGLKRSIDEAGHGTDDALDSIDAKRPRV